MKIFLGFLRSAAALLLLLSRQAAAQTEPPPTLWGHWTAYGRTSQAITGDIALTKSEIIFQKGQRLSLSYVGMRILSWTYEVPKPSFVFRVRTPKDLVFFGHDRLCGIVAPTYLAFQLWTTKDLARVVGGPNPDDELDLMTIMGSGVPSNNNNTRRMCSSYNYSPRK